VGAVTALGNLVGWVLSAFYSLVPNYAVAIVLLGLTFMVLVVPLTLKSTRSMLAMQKLQPKMKQLQQQFKNDRLALNQAVTELYKQEGVSPFGSCIPTLLPLPLFYILYRVIEGLSNKFKHCPPAPKTCADPLYINVHTKMYTHLIHSAPPGKGAQLHALGINLSTSAWTAISQHLGAGEIFGALLLLVLMIAANYYQQVQITNLNPMVRQSQQANPQLQFMRFFPVVFGLLCLRFPSGLVLYYAVTAMFRVGQQWMMYRYDPKVKALVARDDRDIEALEAQLESDGKGGKVPPAKAPSSKASSPPRSPTRQASPLAGDTRGRQGALPVGSRPNGKQQPGLRQADRYQPRARSRRRRGR
jgi:YidC/Oxa1 family membrane protein insertase